MNFACLVSNKGPEPLIVARIARWIAECGLVHFAYRSDKEPAIVAMIQQACAMAGRNGVLLKGSDDEEEGRASASEAPLDRASVAVPEHSHQANLSQMGCQSKRFKRWLIMSEP